jgi:hypothetical protein
VSVCPGVVICNVDGSPVDVSLGDSTECVSSLPANEAEEVTSVIDDMLSTIQHCCPDERLSQTDEDERDEQ